MIVELLTYLSVGFSACLVSNNISLQGENTPWIVVAAIGGYNVFVGNTGKKMLFSNVKHGFESDPQKRYFWKWTFCVLYTPYLAYSIWLGAVFALKGMPAVFVFTFLMCFFLYCAYFRFSMEDEINTA